MLRFDLRRHRIGVSLVCPGGVATPLVETANILGIDPRRAAGPRAARAFRPPRVSPEHVAANIVEGIERDRYVVFLGPRERPASSAH